MKKNRRLSRSDVTWITVAVLLVLLRFWWIPGDNGSVTDSYSNAVDGKLGVYRVLSALFPDVRRETGSLIPQQRCVLLLAGPDRYPSEAEQLALSRFVNDGGCLIFAPGYDSPETSLTPLQISTSARPDAALNSSVTSAIAASTVAGPGPAAGPGSSENEDVPSGGSGDGPVDEAGAVKASETSPVAEGQVDSGTTESTTSGGSGSAGNVGTAVNLPGELKRSMLLTAQSSLIEGSVSFYSRAIVNTEGEDWETLVTDGTGGVQVAVRRHGRGSIVVSASPDVFSNRSLLQPLNGRLVVRLVERGMRAEGSATGALTGGMPVVISEYLNASDSYQSVGALLSPALRPATLQILLVAVLGVWLAFYSFGPARNRITGQRRTLSESAEAVGNLQYQLNDGGTVVRGYLEYVSNQLRRRHGSLVRLDDTDGLVARTGMSADEIRRELADIRTLAYAERVAPVSAARAVRWLCRLQQRLSGIRGRDAEPVAGRSEAK